MKLLGNSMKIKIFYSNVCMENYKVNYRELY